MTSVGLLIYSVITSKYEEPLVLSYRAAVPIYMPTAVPTRLYIYYIGMLSVIHNRRTIRMS